MNKDPNNDGSPTLDSGTRDAQNKATSKAEKGTRSPKKPLNWSLFKFRGRVIVALSASLGAVGLGFLDFIQDKTTDLLNFVCNSISLCANEEDREGHDWTLVFSTAAPYCETGRMSRQLRDWSPPVKWVAEAERLSVCADAVVSGPKESIPQLIGEKFPKCFKIMTSEQAVIVERQTDGAFMCRAPYRYDNGSVHATSPQSGIILCVPGKERLPSQDALPKCENDLLVEYGFKI